MSKIWPPFTSLGIDYKPVKITRGKGVYLYDENDARYLDAVSSWWVNPHGHSHPEINKVLKNQVEELEHCIFADFTHDPAIDISEGLGAILPWKDYKVFFSDNGSTSVEVGIKMAIQAKHNQGKRTDCVVGLKNAYHGDTFGAMSAAGSSDFFAAFEPFTFEVIILDLEADNINSELKKLEGKTPACLVYEPLVQGAGGMKMPSIENYNQTLAFCKEHNITLVADEVMTGFGRTGTLLASDQLETKPDVVCISKCLTGGYMPMGLTIASKAIYDAFASSDPSHTLYHGHSYTANPLACAVANASLKITLSEENLQQQAMINSEFAKIAEELKSHPKCKNVRHRGCILAWELITDGEDSYQNPVVKQIKKMALAEGLLLRPLGNTIYYMPPFIITQEQIQWMHNITLNIIDKL